ncbi:MAG: glycosyltransferase [Patescibacteria group bacterium]|jgi:glycosyltransferase involved in cell wall biosynthesis
MDKSKIKIAFISTYPPRECGIATFTKSFVRIFDEMYVRNQTKIVAVSDEKGKYKYSSRIIFEIDQYNEQSYVKAAEFLNNSSIEVVSIQHEYGIYGGEDGKFVLGLLENLNKPVVTSLHSVLREHSEHRYKLTQRILDLSDSVVVMTHSAKKILTETFRVDSKKIQIVPHGVPNVRFDEREKAKAGLGLKGQTVLSTFGLINRGKGIENAIEALPKVVAQYPKTTYLIIGATHPNILKREGESYRNSLLDLAKTKGVSDNVKFVNKYLDYSELVDYLKATDIYLAPQVDFKQAFSGTLSYALGCGCAAISSPTNYANEVLSKGRGIITLPEPELISSEINKLLSSPNFEKMCLKGYQFARDMIWPKVGLEYLKVLESNLFIKKDRWKQRMPNFADKPSLKYLRNLTDEFGIVQHCVLTAPNYDFGYSLDDQARALIVTANFLSSTRNEEAEVLAKIYLNYLHKAVDSNGLIHNFLDKDRNFVDSVASDDSVARAFWALSYVASVAGIDPVITSEAKKLLPIYEKNITCGFVKSIAYNLLGYCYLGNKKEVERLSGILVERYKENSDSGKWRWFEGALTYANGIVPYALAKAYGIIGNKEYLKIAIDSANFLRENCHYKGIPLPIGQDGWYVQNQRKAIFDQQSIEAGDMALMYNEFYRLTSEKKYKERAHEWMGWYFGNNINGAIVYDNVSRGVFDAVTRRGVNQNQGAESIVTYLLAYLSFKS